MIVNIEFSQVIDELAQNLNDIERKLVPQVTVRALNRTAANLKTRAAQEVANDSGLKQAVIKRALTITNAKLSDKLASVTSKYSAINLIYFKGTRQSKDGVISAAYGKNKFYQGAFIAVMPNKFKGVFKADYGRYASLKKVRAGKNVGKSYRSSKLRELWGPPPSQLFKSLDKFNTTFTKSRFLTEFHTDLKFRLSKLRGKRK